MSEPQKPTNFVYAGIRFFEVPSGTVITDERTSREEIVDDESVVVKGSVAWATAPMIERLAVEVRRQNALHS